MTERAHPRNSSGKNPVLAQINPGVGIAPERQETKDGADKDRSWANKPEIGRLGPFRWGCGVQFLRRERGQQKETVS